MSVAHCGATGLGTLPRVTVAATNGRSLQRLGVVRRLQGISRRTVARQLNLDLDQVREQERATADLPLSALYAWQKALDVPVAELLVEADDSLVSPILERSQLLRLMKTVLAIRQQARQPSIRRMAETMFDQLVEIMPELAQVAPWQAVGKRRRHNELGAAARRCIADDVFIDRDD